MMLVSPVPGDVASGLGAAIAGAGVAMWRRIIVLENQSRDDNAAHNKATSEQWQAALNRKDAELEYWRKRGVDA